jgi:rRNA maturation RNase YbeY
MAEQINFFKEGVTFRLLKKETLRKWINSVAKKEKKKIETVNYIFCTDSYLRKMNKEYLQHDYNTDVITFDNSTVEKNISGDIFISTERVHANARQYSSVFEEELRRVMVHGLLHLLGYDDKNEKRKNEMRKMEDVYLKIFERYK